MSRKITKGTKAFRITYFSLVFLIIAAIAAALIYLWNFLADYEAALPEKLADEFVWRLNSGVYDEIYQNITFEETVFESRETLENTVKSRLDGEFTYTKLQKESTEESPVYKIKCDGEQVAVLRLKQSGEKSGFGFPIYEQASVEPFGLATHSVTVKALNTYSVSINGVKLNQSYIKEKSEPLPQAEFFHGYLENPPYYVTYEADGLLLAPEITVADGQGNPVSPDKSGVYALTEAKDEELIQMGLDFSKLYTKFIANDASFNSVAAYIPKELPLYEDLYYYEGNFYSWHNDYDFSDEWAGELYYYGDNCISVRAKYNHTIYYTETTTFPVDNTVYFVNIDGEWKVTDVVMNFSSDDNAVIIVG